MARKFEDLKNRMPAASRRRAHERAQAMLAEMPLHELRRARKLSQDELAQVLHVGQAAISKMERRTDMYLSTLRRFVEAMDGRLEIIAHFPDGDVRLTSISDIGGDEAA